MAEPFAQEWGNVVEKAWIKSLMPSQNKREAINDVFALHIFIGVTRAPLFYICHKDLRVNADSDLYSCDRRCLVPNAVFGDSGTGAEGAMNMVGGG